MADILTESDASLPQPTQRVNGNAVFDKTRNPVARGEWLIVLAIAVAAVAFVQIPYVLGYALAKPGTEFTGLMINVDDGTYVSSIRQGIEGAWLYRSPFTTEERAPVFIEVFYLALGHLARALNLSAVAMWHVARIVADMVLFAAIFGFVASFLRLPAQRLVAYLLALFSAGFDLWRFAFDPPSSFEAVPIDLRIPEAHIFYSALTFPHFAFGIALVLITFGLLLRVLTMPPSPRQWLLAFGAGLGNFLIGIVYPFLIYLMIAVAGAYYIFLAWRQRRILWREAVTLFVAFAVPAPLFLHYQVALTTNPVLQMWNAQATTLSPNPIHFLLTYTPLLPFALLSLRTIAQMDEHRKRVMVFLWVWVCAVALLLYTPITQQRRFVEGVQVPLAILATLGLFEVALPWLARTRVFIGLSQRPGYSVAGLQRLIIVAMVALASLSSAYVWLSSVVLLGFVQPYPFFRPSAEIQAMDWLRVHSAPEENVIASYWTGSFLPSRADNSVFIGNRYETVRFEDKQRMSEKFFSAGADDAWREALLREYHIAYVFWGRGERDLGDFDPARASYLQPVFMNDAVRIYHVDIPHVSLRTQQ